MDNEFERRVADLEEPFDDKRSEKLLTELLELVQTRRRPVTMPHLMNCAHRDDGWCLDCVKEQGDELIDLKAKLGKFTVVVMQSHKTAQVPNDACMAFVLPTDKLSQTTLQEFRDAAEKGGCAIRMFTGLGPSGIEHVKWELKSFSSTKLM